MVSDSKINQRCRIQITYMTAFFSRISGKLHIDERRFLRRDRLCQRFLEFIGSSDITCLCAKCLPEFVVTGLHVKSCRSRIAVA